MNRGHKERRVEETTSVAYTQCVYVFTSFNGEVRVRHVMLRSVFFYTAIGVLTD